MSADLLGAGLADTHPRPDGSDRRSAALAKFLSEGLGGLYLVPIGCGFISGYVVRLGYLAGYGTGTADDQHE